MVNKTDRELLNEINIKLDILTSIINQKFVVPNEITYTLTGNAFDNTPDECTPERFSIDPDEMPE